MFHSLALPTLTAPPLQLFSATRFHLFINFRILEAIIMGDSDVHQRRSKSCENLIKTSELADVPEAVGLLRDNIRDSEGKARKLPELLRYSEMPDWYQDNLYIIGGYRPISNSYTASFASWGYLHNESVNIYTHGLGAFFYFFVSFGLYVALKDRYATSSVGDVLACGCFFLSTLVCLGASATFHTVLNHSRKVKRFGHALDYLGIICLIAGSFVPNVYYGYYCDPHIQIAYWSMVSDGIPTHINILYQEIRELMQVSLRWVLLGLHAPWFPSTQMLQPPSGVPSVQ